MTQTIIRHRASTTLRLGCFLNTFYVSSGWAKIIIKTQPFDYIIIDESSQALFARTAAIKQLAGKKNTLDW